MRYNVVPFTQDYLGEAAALFVENYTREREMNPLLPSRVIDETHWIIDVLKPLSDNPGIAIVSNGRLVAYMLTGFSFPFKGQSAVQVPVFCHASIMDNKPELYRQMYMRMAEEWVNGGKHLHIIGHLANDSVLKETLFQLGFGAILVERVRNFSPVVENHEIEIVEENDFNQLVDIQIEHMRYYPASPIFIQKDTDRLTAINDLKSYADNGDIFLVYLENDRPGGYFIVGTSKLNGEGFLLQNTKTAQIKSAYLRPQLRGKGIGKALLQSTIDWARKNGYERLFVEHETANYYGGNFWSKYFEPYLYFSMRYVDNTLASTLKD